MSPGILFGGGGWFRAVGLKPVWGSSPRKFWNLRCSQMNSEAFSCLNTILYFTFYLLLQTLSNICVNLEGGGMHPSAPLWIYHCNWWLIKTKYTKPKDKCWPGHRISAWPVCETKRHPPPIQIFLHRRFWSIDLCQLSFSRHHSAPDRYH